MKNFRTKLTTSIIHGNRNCLKINSEVKSKKLILVTGLYHKTISPKVQSSISLTASEIQSSRENFSLRRKINGLVIKKQVTGWMKPR